MRPPVWCCLETNLCPPWGLTVEEALPAVGPWGWAWDEVTVGGFRLASAPRNVTGKSRKNGVHPCVPL